MLRRRIRRVTERWRDRGKPPLHLLHIGKTGGTVIKSVLGQAGPNRYRLLLHPHRVRLADVPVGEKVVLVVRDPVSRFVSGFNSRLRQGGAVHPRPWSPEEAVAFERFPTPEALALALYSADPGPAAAARDAVDAVLHLREHQVAWVNGLDGLRSRSGDLLLVGRQWALDEDFARLTGLLGLPAQALPTDERTAHRTPAGFTTALSHQATAAVRRWYADDYAFLAELDRLGPAVGFAGGSPRRSRP